MLNHRYNFWLFILFQREKCWFKRVTLRIIFITIIEENVNIISHNLKYNINTLMHCQSKPNQTCCNRQDLMKVIPHIFILSLKKKVKKRKLESDQEKLQLKRKLNKHYPWKECLIFFLPFGSFLGFRRLKKIGISIFRPQTDVLDKENVSKNTKAMCHSSFLTDRGKR